MRRSPSLDDLFLQANNPAEFARSALGFFPDPLQESVLRSRHPRRLLCCSRQWGKSTTAAALAIHRLRFSLPGSTVLLLAPTHRQSAELLARMKSFARRLGFKLRGDGQNEHSLLLPNSSRAIALPGTEHSNRGFSAVSLLIVDEAARVPDPAYLALRPTLATSGGEILLMSTPAGQQGFFYQASQSPETWQSLVVPATDCPRIPPSFLDEERREMSEWWFQQEYLCRFVPLHAGGIFPPRAIEIMLNDSLEPI